MSPWPEPLARAYAACERLAQSHYENFPVASRLVPADLRPHIAAIYAFARGADDIADEPGRTPEERLLLLDAWAAHLRQTPRDDVFAALAETRIELATEFFKLSRRPQPFDRPFIAFAVAKQFILGMKSCQLPKTKSAKRSSPWLTRSCS